MNTLSSRAPRSLAVLLSGIGIFFAFLALAHAQDAGNAIPFVSTESHQQVTIGGMIVNGDVTAIDSSMVIIGPDSTTLIESAVAGNTEADGTSQIVVSSAHLFGNVVAADSSAVTLTNAIVEGNIIITGSAVVSIDPATVVHGDIDGMPIGQDDQGNSLYIANQ